MCSLLLTFDLCSDPFSVLPSRHGDGPGARKRREADKWLGRVRIASGVEVHESLPRHLEHSKWGGIGRARYSVPASGGKPLLVFLRFPVRYLCTVELTLMVFCALCIFIGSLLYPLMQGTRQ